MNKTLAALSGGVDSTVAALLLKSQDIQVAGANMRLFAYSDHNSAERSAKSLGIDFYLFDCVSAFKAEVIEPFISEYLAGRTPNPCLVCNRKLKFGIFLENALNLGFNNIATGHYVQTEKSGGRTNLKKAADRAKDQSYFLYSLTQSQLNAATFPLGKLTKTEVVEIAKNSNISVNPGESMDICFIPDGDYANFIEKTCSEPIPLGNFIAPDGNILGEHKGIIHYTIGQRRGLGIAHEEPLYIKEFRGSDIVVSPKSLTYSKSLIAKNLNLIACDELDKPLRAKVKIRSRHEEQPATITQLDCETFRADFDEPQRAITPGQAAVIYDGDYVVGGGIIV